MRTEKEIRDQIAFLNRLQKNHARTSATIGDGSEVPLSDYTKSVLRAQIKALKFVLDEGYREYDIAGVN